jgi:hypothetical protein
MKLLIQQLLDLGQVFLSLFIIIIVIIIFELAVVVLKILFVKNCCFCYSKKATKEALFIVRKT